MDEVTLEARALIKAVDADRQPYVRRFREHWLPRDLLSGTDALDWIGERFLAEPPTSVDTFAEGLLLYSGPYDDHPRAVRPRSESVLDQLRRVAERLASYYRWQPHHATNFVLTGAVPPEAAARITVNIGSTGETIVVEAGPALTKEQLWQHYSAGVSSLRSPRVRASRGDKTARLALFRAEQNDGMTTLREAWDVWKLANPEDDSELAHELAEFQKQMDLAYRRVAGREPPPWRKGRRGSRKRITRPKLPMLNRKQVERVRNDSRARFLADWQAAGGEEESLHWLRRYLPPGPGEPDPTLTRKAE